MMDIEYESDVWQPLPSALQDAATEVLDAQRQKYSSTVTAKGSSTAAHSTTQDQLPSGDDFTFEQRRAIATLLVEAVLRDDRLSDVFLGILLPPPWRGVHRKEEEYAEEPLIVLRSRLLRSVASVPEAWREMICLMPMNMALKAGVYDARLRVAMRRLCRLLGTPWAVIEKREGALSAVDLDELKENDDKRSSILARKEKSKMSLKRVAAVGTFAAVGGVALFFTGGLAAPIIAPAFTALIGATTATLGFVGGIGGALLGGGAIAAAFGALIGLATHAAAMGALLTPLLTAANLTAVFGVGGAGLAGWKGVRRTGASSRFNIRGIDDIEDMPPLRVYGQDTKELEVYGKGFSDEDEDAELTKIPSAQPTTDDAGDDARSDGVPIVGAVGKKVSLAVSSFGHAATDDYTDEMFSQTMCGLVVPVYTVNVTLRNIATGGSIKNRSRINVLAVECHLDGVRLSLAGMKLNFGVWAHAPAKDIPPRHAAIAACHNKVARPTGAGGVICYRLAQYQPAKAHHQSLKLVPVDCPDLKYFRAEAKKLCSKGGLKIWVLSHTTITNTQHIGVVVERPGCKLSRAEIISRLEADNVTEETSYSVDDVMVVAIRFKPHPRVILRFHPKLGRPASHVSGSYPLRELSQHLEDNRTNIERRRVLTIILKNMSDATTVSLKSIQCLTGMPLPGVSLPSVLRAGEAGMLIFTNNEYSFEGAASSIAIEAVLASKKKTDPVKVISGKIQCELSSLGQCKAAALFHCGPLRQFPLPAEVPFPELVSTKGKAVQVSSLVDQESLEPLSFLSASICVRDSKDEVEICFIDAASRLRLSEIVSQRMTMSIGICGFMDTIDPRRLLDDQQVAVWQPVMRLHPLFNGSQALVVDWEEEYLRRFSQTVGLLQSERFANEATGEVIKRGTKMVKRQLLAGALFAGLRAFDALKGTIEFPLYAVYATDLIDNTFATLTNRADYAGKDLAAALLSEQRGHRPVTLVGFSFGATVIVNCLQELHKEKALGIVENVYLLGGVFSSDLKIWRAVREVVAGRVINIYCRSDWLLWALYKANELELKPLAGLAPVSGVPGVENIDASAIVNSHASYAVKLESILNLIPEYPTAATLQQSALFCSPGALVPSGEAASAAERVFSSMTNPMFELDAGVVAITNRIDSGGAFADELKFVGSRLHNEAAFDFSPVVEIPSGHAGVFGFVRDARIASTEELAHDINVPGADLESNDDGGGTEESTEKKPLCGVVGYSLNLAPVSRSAILVLIYFTCHPDQSRGVRSNALAMSVPMRQNETDEDFGKRLNDLVQNQGATPEQSMQLALMGPSTNDEEIKQDFSALSLEAGSSEEDKDWSITMKISEGSAFCSLEGSVSMEVLDQTWSEMLSTRVQAEEVIKSAWEHCPIDPLHTVPVEALSYVMQDFVKWAMNSVALEALSSARTTIISSKHCKSHILFPIVVVNTTNCTLTLTTKSSSSGGFVTTNDDHITGHPNTSSSAEWLRTPPTVFPPETAAVLLLRVAVPQPFLAVDDGGNDEDPLSKGPGSKLSELYGCFSYSADDENQYHFFVKMHWEALPPYGSGKSNNGSVGGSVAGGSAHRRTPSNAALTTTVNSATALGNTPLLSARNASCTLSGTSSKLLSFELRVQCLHDAGESGMANTNFSAVVEDVKKYDGMSLRFVFLRQPIMSDSKSAFEEGDQPLNSGAQNDAEEDATASVPKKSEKADDGSPWVAFDKQ